MQRLDQARGLQAEPIVPVVPFDEPRATRGLLEPITTAEAMSHVIGDLIDDLVRQLETGGLGLRAAVFKCVRVDGDEQRIGLGTTRAIHRGSELVRAWAVRLMTTPTTTYVELQVKSHFSFLRGASSSEELFAADRLLGHSALGLADRSSVAGVVRGWDGQKATGVRMIPDACVDLTDGRALLLYPTNRAVWSRLTRLLSAGKARGGKGRCVLAWLDVAAHADRLVAILVPDLPDGATASNLRALRDLWLVDQQSRMTAGT